jgi:hypothetical protein
LSVVMRMTLVETLFGGSLDVSEETIDRCLSEIRRIHGKEDWFKRHQSPEPLHLKELHFAGCESSLDRLVAHVINTGHDLKTIGPALSRLAGRDLHRGDIVNVLRSLLDSEFIFGCKVTPEDREAIQEAVLQPQGKIPRHLEAFGQIRRMRKFLRMFG